MSRIYTNLANGIHAMSQTTTPSGTQLLNILQVMASSASLARWRDRTTEDSLTLLEADEYERVAVAAVSYLIARNAELEADAGRWREVSDKAWLIDAAAYVYGLRTGTFDPTPEEDEVIAAVDAARTPAKENLA